MFNEIKNAINAAESLESQLDYWKSSILENVDRYAKMEERDEWDNARFAEEQAKLDLYNHVMTCVQKWVKSQI